jgi:osmoprotectant transport system ATP-binding protein
LSFGRLDRMPTENHCSSGPEPVIEFRHASYCLPSGHALLSDLNLSVPNGETVALLGRSGAGKSTALKLINRMLEPSEGEVRVNGRSTLDWDPITLRRQIGYVIQDVGLFPHYTVEQNVSLVPRLEHWPEERIRSRVAELLELVGLNSGKYLSRHPHELSGGQRQRVGIARALAADPPILLMDEPFGALDPLTRAEVQGEFQKVQQNLRKTIVLVTHHVGEALLLGTRIAVLDVGRLVGLYSARDFFSATEPVAAAYVENLRIYEGAEGKL